MTEISSVCFGVNDAAEVQNERSQEKLANSRFDEVVDTAQRNAAKMVKVKSMSAEDMARNPVIKILENNLKLPGLFSCTKMLSKIQI